MKTHNIIVYVSGLALLGVIAFLIQQNPQMLSTNINSVTAESCAADSSGNLFGVITSDKIPEPIYVSLDTWNADPLGLGNSLSNTDFNVNYDRNLGLWSGRGWNESVGWIDFDTFSIKKQARVEDVVVNPAAWGYWDGIIDLKGVSYSTQVGTFTGSGESYDYTGDPFDPLEDVYVGLGQLSFSGLTYVVSGCIESVNLYLNDTPSLYRTNCPIGIPTIKWTSENVSNCTTDVGPWKTTGIKAIENIVGEPALAGLSSGSQILKLKCTGIDSNKPVYGTAIMSCGAVTNADVITAPTIKAPGYIEV
mgnify:FL=1